MQLSFKNTFAELKKYFNRKKPLPTWRWDDLSSASHARAFTIAKMMRLDLLADVKKSLERAIEEGQSFEDWKKEITPTLEKKGWLGKRIIVDSAGVAEKVEYGTPRRLKTIFETNMWSSYQAGRWEQQSEVDKTDFPYRMYLSKDDGLVRPAHQALHRAVFRIDDPIWQYIYPPNGYNCRCDTVLLTAEQARELGLTIAKTERLADREITNKKTGEVYSTSNWRIEVDGKVVEFTPDVGWDGNVGLNYASTLDSMLADKTKRAGL